MRYPYGYRDSLAAAMTAAKEAATLTKVRYFVYRRHVYYVGKPEFVFLPKDDPGPNHEAVRL